MKRDRRFVVSYAAVARLAKQAGMSTEEINRALIHDYFFAYPAPDLIDRIHSWITWPYWRTRKYLYDRRKRRERTEP